MQIKGCEENKTKRYFYRISLIAYLCGLKNFWIEDLGLPRRFIKIYDVLMKTLNMMLFIFVIMEVAAFFTQDKLSDKQQFDLMLYATSHSILYVYGIMLSCNTKELRDLLLDMIVTFKKVYNDVEVEKLMINKSQNYSLALMFSGTLSMIMYTCDSLLLTFRTGNLYLYYYYNNIIILTMIL